MDLLEKLNNFADKKILVIGDLMIDEYRSGMIERISPEAPVPVFQTKAITHFLGGAANTANNVVSMGGKASLIGLLGDDEYNQIMRQGLKKAKIELDGLITDSTRPTTVKRRFITNEQQVFREDIEKAHESNMQVFEELEKKLKKILPDSDAVVISEYDKGFLTHSNYEMILTFVRKNNKPIVIDGKPSNIIYFRNLNLINSLITPNLKEAEEMTGIQGGIEKIQDIGQKLMDITNSNLFITCGSEGIYLFEEHDKIYHFPTKKVDVSDVTGAGDTVVAVSALGMAGKTDLYDIAELANTAGRIVVQKRGTALVTKEELKQSIDSTTIRESYEKHEKKWGHEELIVNLGSAGYCGKKLVLKKEHQCSIHYHKEKDEVFYINKGCVLMIIDGEEHLMKPDDRIRIKPGTRHRFVGLTDSEIIEISSFHKEEDSYREEPSGKVDETKFQQYLTKYNEEISNK